MLTLPFALESPRVAPLGLIRVLLGSEVLFDRPGFYLVDGFLEKGALLAAEFHDPRRCPEIPRRYLLYLLRPKVYRSRPL